MSLVHPFFSDDFCFAANADPARSDENHNDDEKKMQNQNAIDLNAIDLKPFECVAQYCVCDLRVKLSQLAPRQPLGELLHIRNLHRPHSHLSLAEVVCRKRAKELKAGWPNNMY